MLILSMFTTSCVGFGSSTNKNLNPITFAYVIQIKHIVVHWKPMSIAPIVKEEPEFDLNNAKRTR